MEEGARGFTEVQSGRPLAALVILRGRLDLTPVELALLGQAELLRGEYFEAELHLLRPHLLGVRFATVSLGAVYLETGQLTRAEMHFQTWMDQFSGTEIAHARHLLAQIALQRRQYAQAALLAEESAALFLAQGDEIGGAGPLVTSAWALARLGNLPRAEASIRIAQTVTLEAPDPTERIRAWCVLAWVLGVQGRAHEAEELLMQCRVLALRCEAVGALIFLQFVTHELHSWNERGSEAQQAREELAAYLHPASFWQPWVALKRTEQAIEEGRWADGLLALRGADASEPETWATRGRLLAQLGQAVQARDLLGNARARFLTDEAHLQAAHASFALSVLLEGEQAMCAHCEGLEALLRTPFLAPGKLLLRHCPADERLQVWREAAEQHLHPRPDKPQVRMQALGRGRVSANGVPVRGSVPLLTCLMLEGEQTRHMLELKLYPERSATAASSAVKQDIFQLRAALGQSAILGRGARHATTYRLGTDHIWSLDILDLFHASAQLDGVRVFSLLRGEVLTQHPTEWTLSLQERVEEATLKMIGRLIERRSTREDTQTVSGFLTQFAQTFPDRPAAGALSRQLVALADTLP